MTTTMDDIVDSAWHQLRGNLFRRAILGKKMCARIVMETLAQFPDREFSSLKVAQNTDLERQIVGEVRDKVLQSVREGCRAEPGNYGFAIMALVLYWAVSAIVQYLVVQWWKRHFDMSVLRTEYGWK